MSKKTIGEMTLQEAHEANIKSMEQGLTTGLMTAAGVAFANELSELLRKHLDAAKLQTADFAILTHGMAPLVVAFQGALDLRGPDKRPESQTAQNYTMAALATMVAFEERKRARADGSTKASFSDFDPDSPVPPNLYN